MRQFASNGWSEEYWRGLFILKRVEKIVLNVGIFWVYLAFESPLSMVYS